MTINKVNTNLPSADKIEKINDMVIEVNGKNAKAQFDENEITNIYLQLGIDRKFLRNQTIGGTTTDYTDWEHVIAEDGYSIWKIGPTNYLYNANNNLYLDNKVLTNKGQANSETATTFDKVFFYNGDSGSGYTDNTTEAGTVNGTEFTIMNSINDYLYIGDSSTFSGIKFELQRPGSNYTLKIEYYDEGSGVAAWTTLTANTNDLVDNTSDFAGDGAITFTAPSDWGLQTINSSSKYWIRISTTTVPVTTCNAYYIIPNNSVVGLLALSSSEILTEAWTWCTYGSEVYATIRNKGNTSYEGNYFITSSSSSTNLENYFVHNHTFTADYADSTYDAVVTKTTAYTTTDSEGTILVNAGSGNITITLKTPTSATEGKKVTIKAIEVSNTVTVATDGPENIDGNATYTFASQYDSITLQNDGTDWYIIAEMIN